MFEPFRVTAMGTTRSWAKDMFQVGQLPRYLAVFFFWDVRLRIPCALVPFTSEAQPRSLATDRDQVILS